MRKLWNGKRGLESCGNYEEVVEAEKRSCTTVESCGNYEKVVEAKKRSWKLWKL